MNKYQFKTNINCSGCVSAVATHLNANNAIKHWEVDTNNIQKVLTVETDMLTNEMVKEIVENAGYRAERLN